MTGKTQRSTHWSQSQRSRTLTFWRTPTLTSGIHPSNSSSGKIPGTPDGGTWSCTMDLRSVNKCHNIFIAPKIKRDNKGKMGGGIKGDKGEGNGGKNTFTLPPPPLNTPPLQKNIAPKIKGKIPLLYSPPPSKKQTKHIYMYI